MAREGLSICFYMHRSHVEIAQAVIRSLETYLRAVGPQALGWYVDDEGDWQELDTTGWAHIWSELRERSGLIVELSDTPSGASQYEFEYYGKSLDSPLFVNNPNEVCAVSFWLPSEYLEKHGPAHVRELALELAAPLPFNSGHASLAINALMQLLGVSAKLRPWCFRYPGLNVQSMEEIARNIGTRVPAGAHWLTFLGQPVLGELGSAAGLRARLSHPDITVQEMEGERAIVTLGKWPEAGDTEQRRDLPLHRELARVLEPWSYHERYRWHEFSVEDMRRWVRRFLD
ncbi:type VI immunity family protein [Archangium sp.]|uniref:type VI immunity family protein n=1 Tax=Archangium sp. TaxID=1872627 RepID=UPI002D4F7EE9|nr:type VI immunity family protein [Archangium sp.]HYO55986.1 type VI immunity family protein [Archangium sp.]